MQLAQSNKELCKVKNAVEYYLKVMKRCKHRLKLATLYDRCRISNWAINFGTGSQYQVLRT